VSQEGTPREVDAVKVLERWEADLEAREFNLRQEQRAFSEDVEMARREEAVRATVLHRRSVLARVALMLVLATIVGTFGLGLSLITEGLSRNNATFAALGVVLILVATVSSGAAAWRVAGPGFEIGREPVAHVQRAPGGTLGGPEVPPSEQPRGPP
jgi:hypothetical protein